MYEVSPRQQFPRHLQSAALRGGGWQRGQLPPPQSAAVGKGAGFWMRRRNWEDSVSAPQWGGHQRRGFVQCPLGGAGSYLLHLYAVMTAPFLLGCHGDRLHLRRTTEQHVPEVEVQVKRRRTASLSNQECQLYPRRSQQQQVPVVDFQAELRQAFLAETPRGG
ncbi:SNRPN upstream reading frame protein isoform X1 [Lutra lutra]|nr:SNRPN upstream reading frame protein isoform X1 [Lutra lutra]